MHTNTTGGPTDRPTNISSPRHHPDAVASNALANIVTDRLGFVAFTGRYGIAGDFLRWLDEHRPGWQTEPAPTVKPSRDMLEQVVAEAIDSADVPMDTWPALTLDRQAESVADAVLALLPGRREAEVAAEWADYFEQHDQNVGAEPLTPMRMVRILRGPKPFGVERGEGRG